MPSLLILVLIVFVGLTVTSKDGWDRLIYGAITIATLVALYHYRDHLGFSWRF